MKRNFFLSFKILFQMLLQKVKKNSRRHSFFNQKKNISKIQCRKTFKDFTSLKREQNLSWFWRKMQKNGTNATLAWLEKSCNVVFNVGGQEVPKTGANDQGRKKGNFQGRARSANFGGSWGIFSNMAPHKSIFRAIEGGRRVCQGGAPDHFGMPGGPPSFCASDVSY